MAYAVCISVPENTAPRTDGGIYIKHVEFNGRDESNYHSEYIKLEKTLLFEYLKHNNSSFPENLMSVSFNTTMVQNENNTFCENVLKRSIYCKGNNSTCMLHHCLNQYLHLLSRYHVHHEFLFLCASFEYFMLQD